jgi:hypothetical protein
MWKSEKGLARKPGVKLTEDVLSITVLETVELKVEAHDQVQSIRSLSHVLTCDIQGRMAVTVMSKSVPEMTSQDQRSLQPFNHIHRRSSCTRSTDREHSSHSNHAKACVHHTCTL